MSDNTNDQNSAHLQWCQQFGKGAIDQSAPKLEDFYVYGNDASLAIQQKMAEAALAIGWMIVKEVGGLLSEKTIEANRDNIIAGLCDIVENGHEFGPHLGHDIVDAIANALGEVPDRSESVYD